MKFVMALGLLIALPLGWFASSIHGDTVVVHEHQFTSQGLPSIRIAVMGDFHFSNAEDFAILVH